jgi:hypothetical protein
MNVTNGSIMPVLSRESAESASGQGTIPPEEKQRKRILTFRDTTMCLVPKNRTRVSSPNYHDRMATVLICAWCTRGMPITVLSSKLIQAKVVACKILQVNVEGATKTLGLCPERSSMEDNWVYCRLRKPCSGVSVRPS